MEFNLSVGGVTCRVASPCLGVVSESGDALIKAVRRNGGPGNRSGHWMDKDGRAEKDVISHPMEPECEEWVAEPPRDLAKSGPASATSIFQFAQHWQSGIELS